MKVKKLIENISLFVWMQDMFNYEEQRLKKL